MEVNNLRFINFRNLEDTSINFNAGTNYFYGNNGQGKTNILEAIYFSITGKSFRTSNQKDIIKHGFNGFVCSLGYIENSSQKSIAVSYNNNKKEYCFNSKKVKYDEFFGKCSVIAFIPEDIELISGSPSIRRNYFDYEISQTDYNYYNLIVEFNKVLKIRNSFLKDKIKDRELFSIYNRKFIELSINIMKKRYEYMRNLSIIINLNYRKIFSEKAEINICYSSFLGSITKWKEAEISENIFKIYEEVKKKEIIYGYSLFGPQKDDYILYINTRDSKFFSSQGEKKSLLFSLKISEIDMVLKKRGEYPVLLIDDIDSYFDNRRKENIVEYFEKKKIQMFISSTNKVSLNGEFFCVREGKIDEKTYVSKRDN